MKLKEYYSSPHWRKLSKKILDDKDCECQICHRKRWKFITRGKNKNTWKRQLRFALHHKKYDHLFEEEDYPDDLMTLCYTCHDLSHLILRYENLSPFFKALATIVRQFGFIYEKEEKT